ncbi:MAG: MATE family efflux transporter [Sandaracinus sp.]|nr:MATE family efflux transporter [Sandaracinus sp.]|tara:strand:+ start:145 stop:1488 length:1344 start_codon:yes stop_codon:yes gene_type:complete
MRADEAQPPVTGRPATELRALLVLAAPLALMQLAQSGIAAINTGYAAPLGAIEQSGIGLGNSILFAVKVLGMGMVLGFDPLFAQAFGAGEERAAGHYAWQALWLALLVSVPVVGLVLGAALVLPDIGLDPETAESTARYCLARIPGVVPFLVGVAARGYLQAQGTIRPLLIGSVLAVILNAAVAKVLIVGGWGFEGMGARGAGWASSLASAVMTGAMLVGVGRVPGDRRPDRGALMRATRLGLPLSGQLFAEVGMFSLVTLLVGYFGPVQLAAHHVALTLASLTFQVTIAIGSAGSVRVGRAVGQGDVHGTRVAGFTALGLGLALMVVSSTVFWSVPGELVGILIDDPDAAAAAVVLLRVAAVFQIVDGAQAVGAGILRGAGDTTPVFWANVGGHYLVGLPVGLGLAYGLGLGPVGLWWGLSTGLALVALTLALRFHRISRRPILRS